MESVHTLRDASVVFILTKYDVLVVLQVDDSRAKRYSLIE